MVTSVSIRDVAVKYLDLTVLNDMHFDVEQGEFIVLLGPSGCGKSTLLNVIAGLMDVSDGEIWISGRNVTWEAPSKRGIGMVFQSYALYPRMTVRQNLSFGLEVSRLSKSDIAERVARAAAMLQIEPYLDRRPSELSGGQRQRVAIGRALVRNVDVFLFDEPLSNLDAKLRGELRIEIKKLHQALGNTMIYVTHDQVEALTLADRIAVMKNGKIQQFATPAEIYHRPVNTYVAGFVGSPPMSFIPGTLTRTPSSAAFRVGDVEIDISAYEFSTDLTSGAVLLGARAETVICGSASEGLPAVVQLVEPMGSETILWTQFAGQSLRVRTDNASIAKVGDTIGLNFDVPRLSLFVESTGDRV